MRFTLGYQVLAAVILGIGCGLFFGPLSKAVEPIGDIYFTLVQMIALPYILVSLIHGLGSMVPALGKKLVLSGWPFWMALWALVFAVVYGLSLTIPKAMFTTIDVGANESADLVKNFLAYLVPENPIYDLVNNILPAVAACGLIFGIALMHLQNKEPILSIFQKGTELIEKILLWLAAISPIGIFTRLAVVFGTGMTMPHYELFFYAAGFILAVLLLTFWILPALLSSLTPLTYKQAISALKTTCLLPFATAMTTLALPAIIQYMKKLGKQHHRGDPRFTSTSETVLPICYSFGQIGNCITLFFILFLAFYFRHPLTGWGKTILSVFMLPMSVGTSTSSSNTVAFLIEQLHFPMESMEMFKRSSAVTLNFQALVSSASIFTFVVLVMYSYYGSLEIKWKRLIGHFAAIFLVSAATIALAKKNLHLRDSFSGAYLNLEIAAAVPNPVTAVVLSKPPSVVQQPQQPKTDPFNRILEKGILKVGYSAADTPFSYLNNKGELVGFDIAYAYELARDLDCILEFIPIEYDRLSEQLAEGEFDIGMSSLVMNSERTNFINFTEPYEEQDLVLVVPTNRISEFKNLPSLERNARLTLATFPVFMKFAKRHFPFAHLEEFKRGDRTLSLLLNGEADAALWTRVQSFSWTLSHPDFVPIDYSEQLGKCYFAYAIPPYSSQWLTFLNRWLALKEQSGFKERMTRYWLQGEGRPIPPPRWSIMRNVLHWIE